MSSQETALHSHLSNVKAAENIQFLLNEIDIAKRHLNVLQLVIADKSETKCPKNTDNPNQFVLCVADLTLKYYPQIVFNMQVRAAYGSLVLSGRIYSFAGNSDAEKAFIREYEAWVKENTQSSD